MFLFVILDVFWGPCHLEHFCCLVGVFGLPVPSGVFRLVCLKCPKKCVRPAEVICLMGRGGFQSFYLGKSRVKGFERKI